MTCEFLVSRNRKTRIFQRFWFQIDTFLVSGKGTSWLTATTSSLFSNLKTY